MLAESILSIVEGLIFRRNLLRLKHALSTVEEASHFNQPS